MDMLEIRYYCEQLFSCPSAIFRVLQNLGLLQMLVGAGLPKHQCA